MKIAPLSSAWRLSRFAVYDAQSGVRVKKYRDHYFKKAKQENYPARSVYKLQEIDKKFKLLRPGIKVVDLGASPGSWSLYAAERVGPGGRVLAADLNPANAQFPPQVTFLQADVFEPGEAFAAALAAMGPVHVVLSDMAPKTTGVKFTDQARSLGLAEQALALARQCLIQDGNMVIKVFMGPDVKAFVESMQGLFRVVKNVKPQSSRSESKETFLVGLGFRPEPDGSS